MRLYGRRWRPSDPEGGVRRDCKARRRGHRKFVCARTSTISPRQPLLPDPRHLVGEPRQAPTITTNTIVGEVAPHHYRQVAMLVTDGEMPVFPTPVVHRGQRTGKPAFGRDLPNHGLAFP